MGTGIFIGYVTHPLEATTWLFMVSVVSTVLVTMSVGRAIRHSVLTVPRLWLVAAAAAFAAVCLAGSAGAVAVQAARFGLDRVNWVGYLAWAPIYGVLLLPVTLPISWGVDHSIIFGRRVCCVADQLDRQPLGILDEDRIALAHGDGENGSRSANQNE